MSSTTKASRTVCVYLALLCLHGLWLGMAGHSHAKAMKTAKFALMVTVTVASYIWYAFDSKERAYPRSGRMGAAIVLVAFIAVPFYLFKSRAGSQRWAALGSFLLVLLATLFLPSLVALLVATVSGRS